MEPNLDSGAPWKKRFRLPRILVQFAANNPSHVLVASNESGKYQLYSFDLDKQILKQITDRPSGTYYGSVSPDGKHIYFMDDKKGNETGHIVRVPFAGGEAQDLTPSMQAYTLVNPTADGMGSHFGITVPTSEGFDSYVVDIEGGKPKAPRRINRSRKSADGPGFSYDGKVAVVSSTDRFGGLDTTLIAFDSQSGTRMHELADEFSKIEFGEFSPLKDDHRLLATSNKTGVMRPLLWNADDGARVDLEVGDLEGDVVGLGWSADARKVLLCQTYRADTRLWVHSLDNSRMERVRHPEGTVGSACFRGNDEVLLAWQDSTSPTRILSVNLGDPLATPTSFLVQSDVPPSRPWKSTTFKSSDGQEIQGWYAVPEGKGPFPTILDTHGGPTAAQFNVFSPRLQVWLDHGFAVATINYRGSETFGKDFEKKINGDLGHWEVEDMVAAREWLIAAGIAVSSQVFLTGWSYGGYLTLHAMSLYPELWAGGMGGVVVADWVSEYADEPDAMRGYDVALHGGTPAEKPTAYEKASPLHYVDRLAAPLLIIQGKNDVRDPPRQVELYEDKAKTMGKDVTVVWFETGHAGSGVDMELAISHHETMLKWMQGVLLGHHKRE